MFYQVWGLEFSEFFMFFKFGKMFRVHHIFFWSQWVTTITLRRNDTLSKHAIAKQTAIKMIFSLRVRISRNFFLSFSQLLPSQFSPTSVFEVFSFLLYYYLIEVKFCRDWGFLCNFYNMTISFHKKSSFT